MSPIRPDFVECWVFRLPVVGRPEVLLVRRAAHSIFPGLWQPVTGHLEADERAPVAALREVAEEVGIGPAETEALYDLDEVRFFYDEGPDAILAAAVFALRVRPDAAPHLSGDHDALRWVAIDEALEEVTWPSYPGTLEAITTCLMEPERARWFELDRDGRRIARAPRPAGREGGATG
ncbi:MAG: NUDIX domain-containing protein [Chloroflexi bacterium]|jgi:8-oxo-dGTP pyrophosphatase MutT (NUDIX family)|nr:NUDIX domain-containing protein [Chloroflexota bacterium]